MKDDNKETVELITNKPEKFLNPRLPAEYSENEEWVKQHREEFAEEPTFF